MKAIDTSDATTGQPEAKAGSVARRPELVLCMASQPRSKEKRNLLTYPQSRVPANPFVSEPEGFDPKNNYN